MYWTVLTWGLSTKNYSETGRVSNVTILVWYIYTDTVLILLTPFDLEIDI